MKFKLDENFGARTLSIFESAGHDVCTVRQQALAGASDERLYSVCSDESRCLITLDTDFADVTRFSPQRSGGIVVFRLPRNPSLSLLEQLVRQLLHALDQMSLEQQLWIVEVGRIRIHQSS